MDRQQGRIGAIAVALASTAAAQVTERVSVDANGVEGSGNSQTASLSATGRYVGFLSFAPDLVPGDTNGTWDVFVRDRQLGTIERVSVDSSGAEGDAPSGWVPCVSLDGRYVAFASYATNLVPGDTNAQEDIFLRDRQSGTTTLVSVDSSGVQGNHLSEMPELSADGRFVVFLSLADNLVPGDTNSHRDVFVRDLQGGTTERVNVDSSGIQANGSSLNPSISADGRFAVFDSMATNLVPGLGGNTQPQIYLHDRLTGGTELVSRNSSGQIGSGYSKGPAISDDGRYVAFDSWATNLVPGDSNGVIDIFVRDRQNATTEVVSVRSGDVPGNLGSQYSCISGNGRFVGFVSLATDLVPGDTNAVEDVYVYDRQSHTTARASVDSQGAQANGAAGVPQLSFDGRTVAFSDLASNLVPGDTNGFRDVFVRDQLDATDFASLCFPGFNGVIACPCANPPGVPGRGCNNSSGTGGAILSASGGAFLAADTLVFTTSGEKPTALSIVAQWTGSNPAGVIFGMGVRCTSGALKRLYNKSAVAGSITAPDFGAGDLPVSGRSAALGDTILPGQSRWYLVYYRDPIVLGGCPATSTFNATQTGHVAWAP